MTRRATDDLATVAQQWHALAALSSGEAQRQAMAEAEALMDEIERLNEMLVDPGEPGEWIETRSMVLGIGLHYEKRGA